MAHELLTDTREAGGRTVVVAGGPGDDADAAMAEMDEMARDGADAATLSNPTLGLVPDGSSATIRVASVSGPAHHHNVSLRWFAEQVAARNAGLTIEVLDGGQLGGERDYIEGMSAEGRFLRWSCRAGG